MTVYLLWIDYDTAVGEVTLKAVFSTFESAQSYAEAQHFWWYRIDEVVVDEVD